MQTVFKHAHLLGVENANSTTTQPATCLVINDDLIQYIGSPDDEFVHSAELSGALVRDVEGQQIFPGFIDGHMHLLLFGASLKKITLDDCVDLEEIRATIRAVAKAQPNVERIFCQGWTHSQTDGKALASMLDGIDEQNRPIFVDAKDLHSSWCNTAALNELDIQDVPDPVGGTISRDEFGKPSGLLSETACFNIAWPHVAKVASEQEKLDYIREAIRTYHSAGYTGMIEMAMDDNAWYALQRLREAEDLSMRIVAHWIVVPRATDEENIAQVERAVQLHEEFNQQTSPDCRIAGIKLICDGVIDACTAALVEPYSSNRTNCEPLWRADALRKVVEKADKSGLQCALHAIGDATVKMAVDTLEAVGTRGRRHRIEHLELTSPEDARRLGQLGITASVQPVHSDPAGLKAWPALIGDRLSRAFAYKEFHTHGANLAFGTDAPTASHLPFPNLYTAVTRRSAKDPKMLGTCNSHFAVSYAEALAAATKGSAYSCFAENSVGTLTPGKKADFVIARVDSDPTNLLKAKVMETWFNGQQVFTASEA